MPVLYATFDLFYSKMSRIPYPARLFFQKSTTAIPYVTQYLLALLTHYSVFKIHLLALSLKALTGAVLQSSVLKSLHWLPVQQQNRYKLSLITLNVRSTSANYFGKPQPEASVLLSRLHSLYHVNRSLLLIVHFQFPHQTH